MRRVTDGTPLDAASFPGTRQDNLINWLRERGAATKPQTDRTGQTLQHPLVAEAAPASPKAADSSNDHAADKCSRADDMPFA